MNLFKNNFDLINIIINKSKKMFSNIIFKKVLFFVIITLIFGLAYRQAPIYQSNQHTKFLHGLAKADYGYLKNDWLSRTVDPLPEFSFLVFLTAKFLNEYFFYFIMLSF